MDPDDMDNRAGREQNSRADRLEEEKVRALLRHRRISSSALRPHRLTHRLGPFGVKECDAWCTETRSVNAGRPSRVVLLTDNSELDRHEKPEEVEEDLQWGPFLSPEE